jgi:ADP-ribose pyrophosphatase
MGAAVRLVSRRVIYRGRIVRVVRDVLRAGKRRLIREVIGHPGVAVVLPLLDDGRVVFVRQYRHAVRRTLLELPAGTLGPRESPRACARRELEEETGWRAGRLRPMARFYGAPGVLSEVMHLFAAERLVRGRARPEPDERLAPVILPLPEALRRVHAGTIRDAKTIIGVLLAEEWLRVTPRGGPPRPPAAPPARQGSRGPFAAGGGGGRTRGCAAAGPAAIVQRGEALAIGVRVR